MFNFEDLFAHFPLAPKYLSILFSWHFLREDSKHLHVNVTDVYSQTVLIQVSLALSGVVWTVLLGCAAAPTHFGNIVCQ